MEARIATAEQLHGRQVEAGSGENAQLGRQRVVERWKPRQVERLQPAAVAHERQVGAGHENPQTRVQRRRREGQLLVRLLLAQLGDPRNLRAALEIQFTSEAYAAAERLGGSSGNAAANEPFHTFPTDAVRGTININSQRRDKRK